MIYLNHEGGESHEARKRKTASRNHLDNLTTDRRAQSDSSPAKTAKGLRRPEGESPPLPSSLYPVKKGAVKMKKATLIISLVALALSIFNLVLTLIK